MHVNRLHAACVCAERGLFFEGPRQHPRVPWFSFNEGGLSVSLEGCECSTFESPKIEDGQPKPCAYLLYSS